MNTRDIKEQLKIFICAEIIRNPSFRLEDDDPLITGGLVDSQSLVQIAVFLEEAFNVFLPDTDLNVDNMDTVEQIAARVMAEGNK